MPTRHAHYTANLVIMIVIANGETRLTELFPRADQIATWFKHVLLWRSQTTGSEFTDLADSLTMRSTITRDEQDAVLDLDDGSFAAPEVDLDWIYHELVKNMERDETQAFVLPHMHPGVLARRSLFQIAKTDALLQHTLEPLVAVLKDTVNSFVRFPGDRLRTTAHVLMRTVFLALDDVDDDVVAAGYLRCARIDAGPVAVERRSPGPLRQAAAGEDPRRRPGAARHRR